MKQHRPRMSEVEYLAYRWMKTFGSLDDFRTDYRKTKGKESRNQYELTKLRRDNKLAPLLAIASVAVGVLIGWLIWG